MGRFRDAGEDDGSETAIDMSPLIDCVFILLIFFIVTTVFVDETGIEVNKPEAATAASLEKNSILLAVTAEGDVVYDSKSIGVNNVRALVKRLVAKEDMPVIVQVDKDAKAELLVKVTGEARAGGATKVSAATKRN